jgi:Nickel responsive protein SCO4226-like
MIVPLFMDIHNHVEGLTADAVAHAHQADLKTQEKYGVKYLRYWFDEGTGRVFCLVEAPSKEAAITVHREAHGLVADEVIEVKEGA